jgi:hypothetical protein
MRDMRTGNIKPLHENGNQSDMRRAPTTIFWHPVARRHACKSQWPDIPPTLDSPIYMTNLRPEPVRLYALEGRPKQPLRNESTTEAMNASQAILLAQQGQTIRPRTYTLR